MSSQWAAKRAAKRAANEQQMSSKQTHRHIINTLTSLQFCNPIFKLTSNYKNINFTHARTQFVVPLKLNSFPTEQNPNSKAANQKVKSEKLQTGNCKLALELAPNFWNFCKLAKLKLKSRSKSQSIFS